MSWRGLGEWEGESVTRLAGWEKMGGINGGKLPRESEPWNLMERKGVVYGMRTEASTKPRAGLVASETLTGPSNFELPVASGAGHFRCWTHWCPIPFPRWMCLCSTMPAGQLFLLPFIKATGQRSQCLAPECTTSFRGSRGMCISLRSHDSLHLTGTAALEEDAQILKVIEAYCTSANFQQGHGSSRFPQTTFSNEWCFFATAHCLLEKEKSNPDGLQGV